MDINLAINHSDTFGLLKKYDCIECQHKKFSWLSKWKQKKRGSVDTAMDG